MDKQQIRLLLNQLHNQKMAISKHATSAHKYALNNLTNAINKALSTLKEINLPTEFEHDKSTAISTITDSLSVINNEPINITGSGPRHLESQKISEATALQARKIVGALGIFDGEILQWL